MRLRLQFLLGGNVPTVDGSFEIRRSPVEVGSLSHCLQGFIHPGWCRISSINSSFETLPYVGPCLNTGSQWIVKVNQYGSLHKND